MHRPNTQESNLHPLCRSDSRLEPHIMHPLSLALSLAAIAASSAVVQAQQFQFMTDQRRTPALVPPPGAGQRTHPPVAADFDGDGRNDVVYLTTNGFEVQRNLGGGNYAATLLPLSSTVSQQTVEIRAADLDGDGDQDLVLANVATIEWRANNGNATFATAQSFALAGIVLSPFGGMRQLHTWESGDIDNDGDLDMLRSDGQTVRKVENLGAGTFSAPAVVLAGPPSPTIAIVLSDLDGDSDLDLATTATRANGNSELMRNDGAGNFASAFTANMGTNLMGIVELDADGDGDRDLLVAGLQPTLNLHRNQGNGTFLASTLPSGAIAGVTELHVADFDRDGDSDVLVGGFQAGLLSNDGTGNFLNILTNRLPQTNSFMLSPTVLDIDDDGDPDIDSGQVPFGGRGGGLLINHVRQLVSATQPRIGGTFDLDIFSGPGFAPPGITMMFASLALPSAPAVLPGIEGKLDLDLTQSGFAALRIMSSVGVTRVTIPIPNIAALAGNSLVFQHARLPQGLPPGFGNAVFETVLP